MMMNYFALTQACMRILQSNAPFTSLHVFFPACDGFIDTCIILFLIDNKKITLNCYNQDHKSLTIKKKPTHCSPYISYTTA